MRFLLLSGLIALCFLHAQAQLDEKKNTAYINISHPAIFGSKTFIVGYERVLSKHRSFTINFGSITLPKLAPGNGNDSVSVIRNSGDNGFHLGADYRFYLKGENKYEAPRGVYLGPYYAYNNFSKSNTWKLNTSDFDGEVNTKLGLGIHTIGVQMGYQFVFWKRVALDLILLGPGMGFYNIKGDINTTLSAEDESLLFEQINNFLGERIPGYNLVIDEGEFQRKGNVQTSTLGYRFMINVGFRF
ncbi:MAG: hypothetical protein MUE99_09775 [Chitinophagaceae bacterium]|jgi:hypothetical protein|nr:hypothetical protein [Chitinophagaceae bacterium]